MVLEDEECFKECQRNPKTYHNNVRHTKAIPNLGGAINELDEEETVLCHGAKGKPCKMNSNHTRDEYRNHKFTVTYY